MNKINLSLLVLIVFGLVGLIFIEKNNFKTTVPQDNPLSMNEKNFNGSNTNSHVAQNTEDAGDEFWDEELDATSSMAAVIRNKNRRIKAASSTPTTTTATTSTSTVLTTATPISTGTIENIMAWIYPGNPACSAAAEYADGRKINTLKAEFFTINGGELTLLTVGNAGCNGYSGETITNLKKYSTEQYATISSASTANMDAFFASTPEQYNNAIATLVSFTVDNNITGIELDFEDFGSWTNDSYANYKKFVTELGNALHAQNKKLMLNAPAVSNSSEEKWFKWRYSDFVSLPVDNIVVMAYDYQFDNGAGSPIAPFTWLKNVINWTGTKYPKNKLTIGIPTYGYQGVYGSYRTTILTYEQIKKKTGFATATRDPNSGEMYWRYGTNVYFYQDQTSLNQKKNLIASLGINSISVWHLGGNPWF